MNKTVNSLNVKFSHNSSKGFQKTSLMLFLSVLFVMLLIFSPLISMFRGISPFVTAYDEEATDQASLEKCINDATDGVLTVIGVKVDILLTKTIEIPAGKIIKLINIDEGEFFNIIGVADEDVFKVAGELTINGVNVKHPENVSGRGITVMFGGVFILSAGALYGNTAPSGDGGGVVNNGNFTLTGTGEIYGNSAPLKGGGVANHGNFTMSGYSKIYENCAGDLGGGVANVMASNFTLFGGDIYNNFAVNCGGGVYNQVDVLLGHLSNFTLVDGAVHHNKAEFGGGVYNQGGNFTLTGTGKVYGNTATVDGGGVYNNKYSTILVRERGGNFTLTGDGRVCGNTAGRNGGGVYNEGALSNFTLVSGEVVGNSAVDGGGMYVLSGNATLWGGTISGNTASGDGGGIWVTAVPPDVIGLKRLYIPLDANVEFSNNLASAKYNLQLGGEHEDTYTEQVPNAELVWSFGFPYGYNNYDISYVEGYAYFRVTVIDSWAGASGEGFYAPENDEFVTINAGNPIGYIFDGWTLDEYNEDYLDSSDSFPPLCGNTNSESFQMSMGNLVFTAHWIQNTSDDEDAEPWCTLSYNGNGHTNGVVPVDSNSPYTEGSPVVLLGPGNMIKSDYTFLGWATSTSASETTYYNEDDTFDILDNTVLYAIWASAATPTPTLTPTPTPAPTPTPTPTTTLTTLPSTTPPAPSTPTTTTPTSTPTLSPSTQTPTQTPVPTDDIRLPPDDTIDSLPTWALALLSFGMIGIALATIDVINILWKKPIKPEIA